MFARLRNLFKKKRSESPLDEVAHPTLGVLLWSADGEAWFGTYRGFRFSLGYEGQAIPSDQLAMYALEIMDNSGWLNTTFSEAKREAIRSFEAYYSDEIRSLKLGTLHFASGHGTLGLLADLEGGRNYRLWRIEYEGRRCFGIGFDD